MLYFDKILGIFFWNSCTNMRNGGSVLLLFNLARFALINTRCGGSLFSSFSRYRSPRYQRFANNYFGSQYGYKRVPVDRIAMGFIKRGGPAMGEHYNKDIGPEINSKMLINSEASPVVRKKRYVDYTGHNNDNSEFTNALKQRNRANDDVDSFHSDHGYEDKDAYIVQGKKIADNPYGSAMDKRRLDRIGSSFVKKDDSEPDTGTDVKRLDRISIGLIQKHADPDAEKRRLDDIASDIFKRKPELSETADDKRGLDRLYSGFVKKGLDRISSSFIKKDASDVNDINDDTLAGEEPEKRGLDRLSMGFVKKDEFTDELVDASDKRGLDRLSMGFVKKDNGDDNDKRGLDRLSMGFVKKSQTKTVDKRRLDRLGMGFVKKDTNTGDYNSDMNGMDAGEGFQNHKRRFDRISSGLVKKDNTVDDSTSYIVSGDTESNIQSGKRRIDRLSMGFVKKNENDNTDVSDNDDGFHNNKRGFDRISSGFVKKDIHNYEDLVNAAAEEDGLQTSKRRFDRLSSGFVKRQYEKRRFDRLSMGFVKKDPELTPPFNLDDNYINKRRGGMDNILMEPHYDFVYGNYRESDKRGLDRLSMGFVKRNLDPYADRMGSSLSGDKRYMDRLSLGFVKKNKYSHINNEDSAHSVVKRNADMGDFSDVDDTRAIKRVGFGFIKRSPYKRNLDRIGYGFVKKRFNGYDMGSNKRYVDRVYNGIGKKKYPYSELENDFRDELGPDGYDDIHGSDTEYELDKQSVLQLINELENTLRSRRYIDRIGGGFLVRDSGDGLDDIPDAYPNPQVDKRSWTDARARLDRIGYGFIKRDATGFMNDMSSTYVPQGYSTYSNEGPSADTNEELYGYANRMKKGFDRLNYGLVKRSVVH